MRKAKQFKADLIKKEVLLCTGSLTEAIIPYIGKRKVIIMAKGNLYTHLIKRKNDPRIEILSFLKAAYRTTPRDWEYIDRLKKQLKELDAKNPPYQKRKKLRSAFDWVRERDKAA